MRTAFPVLALLGTLLLPASARADAPTTACQRAVARGGAKFATVVLKVSQGCAMRALRGGAAMPCRPRAGGSTGDAATDAAIARAARRLGARVADVCATADLSAFARRCVDPTGPPLALAELVACLRDTHLDRVGAMVGVEFPGLAARATAAAGGCESTELCECRCASASGSFLVPLIGDVL